MVAITGLTALTLPVADADLLEITDDVAGTPVSRKVTVGDLMLRAYGEIYVNSGSAGLGPLLVGAWTTLTQFAANGLSKNTTPDHANDKITIANAGVYLVSFSVSFRLDGSATCEFAPHWNGAIQSGKTSTDITSASNHVAAGVCLVNVTSGATDLDLRARVDVECSLTVVDANLACMRIA